MQYKLNNYVKYIHVRTLHKFINCPKIFELFYMTTAVHYFPFKLYIYLNI